MESSQEVSPTNKVLSGKHSRLSSPVASSRGLEHDIATNKALSPRDTTKVSVAGEDFNPDQLPPIPVPRLRSQDVPKKLPSTLNFRRQVTSARVTKSPLQTVPTRVTSSPLMPLPNSSKRIRVAKVSASHLDKGKSVVKSARLDQDFDRFKVVSQGLPLTPAPMSISKMPIHEEERVVRVIRAAPRGFLNIPNIPDYSILTPIQQEAMRAKFNMKMEVIRKNKPSLPLFKEEEPLHIIHVKYDQYVRQAHIDKTIVKYKIYLTIVFLIIEAIGCKLFNIPIAGYTSDQLNQFIFYEQFLMEIAERQKEGGGDEWPVEVRIFIFMIFQAVIFVIIKGISSFLPVESTKTIRAQINEFMMPSKGVVLDADGIAEPPSSGFDPTGLLNMVGSFIGGGNNTNKPPADVTKHTLPFDD
nr:putative membrane protein [Cedratvirus duvanny]